MPLVLVVGPSGAGKDTLIAIARERLADDARFVFPRRLVTREAVAVLEDHETISWDDYRARVHALSWEAHGLGYALPIEVEAHLEAGRTVVVNVSRRIVASAAAKYPGTRVVLIGADPAVRAGRLRARGRESDPEIALRLAREGDQPPAHVPATAIDNSGDLGTAVAAFLAALDLPPGRGSAQ